MRASEFVDAINLPKLLSASEFYKRYSHITREDTIKGKKLLKKQNRRKDEKECI